MVVHVNDIISMSNTFLENFILFIVIPVIALVSVEFFRILIFFSDRLVLVLFGHFLSHLFICPHASVCKCKVQNVKKVNLSKASCSKNYILTIKLRLLSYLCILQTISYCFT